LAVGMLGVFVSLSWVGMKYQVSWIRLMNLVCRMT